MNRSAFDLVLNNITIGFVIRFMLEVGILAAIIYEALAWIKNTKTWILLKGIGIIIGFTLACYLLGLNSIIWVMNKLAYISVTACLIIFQPELRKILEKIGNQNLFNGVFKDNKNFNYELDTFKEIAKASFLMGSKCTGALMVLKREQDLTDIKNTGIVVDGVVTSALIINIFEKNTPLHDGAVVIEGDRVASATCYLPLSENDKISKDLGTRHRAALGVSEVTDTVTIIVSEETGRVTLAIGGNLKRMSSEKELIETLEEQFRVNEEPVEKRSLFRRNR